jgi:N-hydroxyarylamine O-acetyltransferase
LKIDDGRVDQMFEQYLRRIGLDARPPADAAGLPVLMEHHLATVPFENLSIHLDEPIVLEEEALLDKLVARRRGGFCYELNGAFAALLRALGYDVTLLSARVHTPAGLGPPFDHLALRVDLDDAWLVDVGFGRFVAGPLRLDSREPQHDQEGEVRLVDADGGDVDVLLDAQPQYRLDLRSRELDEFVPTCWWHETWPGSHFREQPTCSRSTPDGRVTIAGRTLIRTRDGRRTEDEIADDWALREAYAEHFGIVLDRLPARREETVQ